MLFEIVISTLVVLLAAFVLTGIQGRYQAAVRSVMWISLAGHVVFSLLFIWMNYSVYGKGDIILYMFVGQELADGLRMSVTDMGPEVLKLLLQQSTSMNVEIDRPRSTTGSMYALTGIASFLTLGSAYGTSLLFGMCAFFGKVMLFEGLRSEMPQAMIRRRMIWAVMLLPSVIYWSSSVVKEGVATAGMGLMFLAMTRVVRGRWGWIVGLAAGSLVVGLIKPYILFVFLSAMAVFVYWVRSTRDGKVLEIRPLYLGLAALLAILGVLALGSLFPSFSITKLGDEVATYQSYARKGKGASTYLIGDPNETSLLGQMVFAPIALLTAWYRPLIIEVYNAPMLLNAVEGTAFIVMTVRAFQRQSVASIWRSLSKWPILSFCVTFAVFFGVAVGLVSGNLGTLSRYRIPLLPLLAGPLLLWSLPAKVLFGSPSPPQKPAQPGHPGRAQEHRGHMQRAR